ncbi:MAG TPA: glycosyltransferase family 4 protein [Gemmatimonadales bacterium]|jgi:glycosyltransferase involved in cell wall biosynthesis
MKVLFVNPGRELGGAEQSLLLLLDALRRHSVDCIVATFGDGPFSAALLERHIPVTYVSVPDAVRATSRYSRPAGHFTTLGLAARSLPTVWELARIARAAKSDLIHTNGIKAHLLGGLAGRMLWKPVVWHVRDFPPEGMNGVGLRAAAKTLPRLVFTNSAAVAAAVRARAAPRAPVVTLYNAVDLERFNPRRSGSAVRAELQIESGAPLVGMVAHLTPWKGHADFLRIARAVSLQVPGVRFLVSGGPIYETEGHAGYEESLRSLAAELGIADRVTFLGSRTDIPEIMAALDVLVHCPTAPEPFGRAVAEAMGAGKPVIASKEGGVPELVEDGRTGVLIPSGDIAAFAAALRRLLDDQPLRRRMGSAGRLRAEAMFGVEAHAERVLRAYGEIV